MATIGVSFIESFKTDTDLTANQFFAVTTGSAANTVILATGGSAPIPIGVLLNSPSSTQAAEVGFAGRLKMKVDAGTAINNGDLLTVNASGVGTIATGCFANGMALGVVASGCAIIDILWFTNTINIAHNTP